MKKTIAAILAACTLSFSAQFAYAEYINVSGRTIGEVAEQAGYTDFNEFLTEYGLPSDLSADTTESDAYYTIPTGKIAEMYGMELDELKETLGLGDNVTYDTTWGEAESQSPLRFYIGEEYLDAFKAEYGLGDEVTADTLWGEVRNIVDQKALDDNQRLTAVNAQQIDDAAEASSVTILKNGEELALDVNAYIKNDRTMVPLRGVFEACGASVAWDDETKTAFITKASGEETTFIFLQADSDAAFVNSEKITLDTPAEIVNDRTMVPLRFIMEQLGAEVSWDGESRTVSIVTE